jgi:IgGFc binding protein
VHARFACSIHRSVLVLVFALAGAALAGCGGNSGDHPDGGGGGIDAAAECTADGDTRCVGATYETCSGGTWTVTQQCPVSCDASLGCVECTPGVDYCDGDDVHSCNADGTEGPVTTTCTGTQVCVAGGCTDPCADAADNRSYLGCEYYAVDLDNAIEVLGPADSVFGCLFVGAGTQQTLQACYDSVNVATAGLCDEPGDVCPTGYTCQSTSACVLDAQHSPFAIVVSNPQSKPVDVTITDAAGTTKTMTVAADAVQSLFPQQLGFTDMSLDWTMQDKRAYQITSTLPIVAYQFNPLDNVGVFSNDASLLIPRATFDTKYFALGYPTLTRRPDTNDYNAYVTIVAWQDGTMVDVTPTADVRASATSAVITAGTTVTFALDAFDVVNLEAVGAATAGIDGPDLSGTVIESQDDKTFGVFTGTEASVLPSDQPSSQYPNGPCCADHLEEMMFPTSTWGKTFAIARSQVRLTQKPERDVLRILAQTDGTTVTFDPTPAVGTCGTLNAGQFCEVEISADTAVTGSEPILVGHYLTSAIWQDALLSSSVGSGDPSQSIAVPTEQYRSSYAILIPSQYDASYVSLVVGQGGSAMIDGNDVTSQLTGFAGGTFLGGRIAVTAGAHQIQCSAGGCGVEVYGYSDAVSFMVAGGLDLKQIVIGRDPPATPAAPHAAPARRAR